MTTRILYIIFVIGLFITCNNRTEQKGFDNSEINEILNIVFDATVGPDTLWSKNLLIPPVFLPQSGQKSDADKVEFVKYLRSIDNLKMKLDTAKLYVFINDSLVKFPENRIRIKSMTESKYFMGNFEIDSTFRPLIVKLFNYSESRPLDISKLKSKYNYQIDFISNKDKYPSSIIEIGSVNMTNPVFNSDLTMACIYSEIFCGGECGGGSIIFLKKVNGQWKIEGQRQLWVS
jgi:hypothetical protein